MLPSSNKYFLSLIFFCFSLSICLAQKQKEDDRFHFQSIDQVGLLNGEISNSWQLQTINGVQYKSWFGGIGAGLDYYRMRSIPVFADIRKIFGHSENKLFVYADGGMSFTWATDKEKNNFGYNDHFSNGLYLDGGVGYQIHISGRNALLLSLGYSYKTVKETYPFLIPLYFDYYNPNMPAPGTPSNQTNTYNYQLNRISIKIGWRL
ncbi:MAG: hypothetical protein Q8918_12800 [Bacteroidota bacterium]|nr:hypothetical protein [Bacteroidota bacterium]